MESIKNEIDSFTEIAKDYAKAEKELGVQKWVFISFERLVANGNKERIFSYDLPRSVYERREWVIRWREAKLICKYPLGRVRHYVSYYDKRLGNTPHLTRSLSQLIAAKAQVSKVQRKIDAYVEYNRANNLFFDEDTDPELLKVRAKLSTKIANVQAAEERMKQIIKDIKSESTNIPF